MESCEVERGKWSGHPHYFCARCNISTTDEATYLRRCQLQAPAGRLESATGLFGPDGQPLPPPSAGEAPGTHDGRPEPEHVGGGWYALPDGTRVQGLDNALEAQRTHDQ